MSCGENFGSFASENRRRHFEGFGVVYKVVLIERVVSTFASFKTYDTQRKNNAVVCYVVLGDCGSVAARDVESRAVVCYLVLGYAVIVAFESCCAAVDKHRVGALGYVVLAYHVVAGVYGDGVVVAAKPVACYCVVVVCSVDTCLPASNPHVLDGDVACHDGDGDSVLVCAWSMQGVVGAVNYYVASLDGYGGIVQVSR